MVDLHDSLRPTGSVPPLPVSEIATRGRRRKRRRLASTTGMAVATLGIAAFAISSLPRSSGETVTVADVAEDAPVDSEGNPAGEIEDGDGDGQPSVATSTPVTDEGDRTDQQDTANTLAGGSTEDSKSVQDSESGEDSEPGEESESGEDSESGEVEASADDSEPTTTSTTTGETTDETAAGTGPETSATADPLPMTTPGIKTSETATSQWEDGYCIQVEVSNEAQGLDMWQVELDLNGVVATVWNATFVQLDGGTVLFTGLAGYNEDLGAGSTTSFGTCVDTDSK